MSVFLLTVAFVVGFLPGVFQPFSGTGSSHVLTADRSAGLLAEQLLASPATPGVLNATCTAEFFDADGGDGTAACRFDTDSADLSTALGLDSTTHANVTIAENGTVRRARGVRLRAGATPPSSGDVMVSHRVVLLDGEESDLYVRVW